MKFSDIVAISGKGGLFRLETQRVDGCIVQSLQDDTTNFVSNRNHLFTALENISIYTDTDSEDLLNVFRLMKNKQAEVEIPESNSSSDILKNYLAAILPDYDREKVYVSDIKKLIKWYAILDEKGIIEQNMEESKEEDPKAEKATEGDSEDAEPDK